jgi:thiol-disulfide isomerase/thioredoxin
MRVPVQVLVLTFTVATFAQTTQGPSDPKAQKTYADGLKDLHAHHYFEALDKFKKANKQNGGHCIDCLKRIVALSTETGDFKAADAAARDLIAGAQGPAELALYHAERGSLLLKEGSAKKKTDLFSQAHEEYKAALAADPKNRDALYGDGVALARLQQDDAAKAAFQAFAEMSREGSVDRARALRLAARPELARERMAPAFAITGENGQRLSMDDLQGKVVLIDFWATWCEPCREALPHIKRIAQKFSGEPLVIVSVSLDSDEQKWKNFVAQNEMTWFQYRDGGFTGPMARLFQVDAIPHTFTIDSDGVLQDEKVGDSSIEGKLKKLIAQARQLQQARDSSKITAALK